MRKARKAIPKKISHRKPPKPVTWDSPKGSCRFCGEPIIENGKQNNRKNWHTECVHVWKVMNDPKYAREFVYLRDHGKCRDCSCTCALKWYQTGSTFEVDHVKPLFEANGDLSYWHPDNLLLRCTECHKLKTKSDMERYRAAKEKKE